MTVLAMVSISNDEEEEEDGCEKKHEGLEGCSVLVAHGTMRVVHGVGVFVANHFVFDMLRTATRQAETRERQQSRPRPTEPKHGYIFRGTDFNRLAASRTAPSARTTKRATKNKAHRSTEHKIPESHILLANNTRLAPRKYSERGRACSPLGIPKLYTTRPPSACILLLSSGLLGLWSLDIGRARPSEQSTARESPTFPTTKRRPRTNAVIAVDP